MLCQLRFRVWCVVGRGSTSAGLRARRRASGSARRFAAAMSGFAWCGRPLLALNSDDLYGKVFHQRVPSGRVFSFLQTARRCGTLNTLSLSDRTFPCQGCGQVLDRDLNPAQNIKQQSLLNILAGDRWTA